jgi:hypothetical protein
MMLATTVVVLVLTVGLSESGRLIVLCALGIPANTMEYTAEYAGDETTRTVSACTDCI